MAGRRRARPTLTVYIIGRLRRLYSPLLAAALLAIATAFLGAPRLGGVAHADHLMCDWKVERRTQTVWIDPNLAAVGVTRDDVLAAFDDWNQLFVSYYGFPIFATHTGDPFEADIMLRAQWTDGTWVQTPCTPGFVRRGNVHSIVLLGRRDAWRNAEMLPHELGHALGLADHGTAAQRTEGHVGFRLCDGTYIGVMSYCTAPQSWFLDFDLPGVTLDGDMVRGYW